MVWNPKKGKKSHSYLLDISYIRTNVLEKLFYKLMEIFEWFSLVIVKNDQQAQKYSKKYKILPTKVPPK